MPVRRWVPALIILGVAGALGWWGTRTERQEVAAVEAFVAALVDPSTTPAELPVGCDTKLEPWRGAASKIDVRTGDLSPFGDGSATHTATLMNPSGRKLGLRLLRADGRTTVIGCWDY